MADDSELMTEKRCGQLHDEAVRGGDVLIWTIYYSPTDYPGKFVCRPWSVRRNAPLLHHLEAASLEAMRGILPQGLAWFPRQKSDDHKIVETWM